MIWKTGTFGLMLLYFGRLSAAVIGGGDTGYTTAPVDDPGWNRVGRVGSNGSGVYLGNGWVLTANHVSGKTTFTVEGDPAYTVLPGVENTYRVQQVGGGAGVDLYMFRVGVGPGSGLDGLGILNLASSLPSPGSVGMHIGTGEGQTSDSLSTWYVDTSGRADNWVWSTNPADPYDFTPQGYRWAGDGSRDTRWNAQPLLLAGSSGN